MKKLQKWMEAKRSEIRKTESGNVLFLILIAVALFAALSYAVTSSSRSGGGDSSSETNLINSATITQYPASIRTTIMRMIISSGIDVTAINFDGPPYDDLTTDSLKENGVFYPASTTPGTVGGGGATFNKASLDVMDSGDGTWHFSGNYAIENVGLDSAGAGNDIIAFLPGIKESVCNKINEELGIPTTDKIMTDNIDVKAAAVQMDYDYTFPSAITATIGTTGGAASFDGQPFGCIEDSAGEFIYYHVLVER